MKNGDYWKKRYEQLENHMYNFGIESYSKIEKAFRQVQQETNNQIEKWFNRIATNNMITMLQAKKKLNKNELEEFKWTVQEYIKKGQENAVNQKWIKELENASAKAHITRLQALQIHTQQLQEIAFANQLDEVDKMAKKVYTESFNRSNWILQTGNNTGFNMGAIDERQLEEVIKKPWTPDGREFSERIWGNRTKMINELHQELVKTILRGGSPDEAIKHMAKFVEGEGESAKKNAARLIQTEQAYFTTVSKIKSFKELDVEKYQIVATFDLQTSKICQEMDKKIFNVEDCNIGVNAPPLHPRCRSDIAPYYEKRYFTSTRAARDADGKTVQIPEDMTYKEWYELYGKDYKVKQDEILKKKKEREKAKKKRDKEKAKKQQEKEEKEEKQKKK